jgi:hypothetical protein
MRISRGGAFGMSFKKSKTVRIHKTFVEDFMIMTTYDQTNLMRTLSNIATYIVYFGTFTALVYSFIFTTFI